MNLGNSFFGSCSIVDLRRAVNFFGDSIDFLFNGKVNAVNRAEIGRLAASLNNLFSELNTAVTAFAEYILKCKISAVFNTVVFDIFQLSLGVGSELIDSNNNRNTVFAHVLNVNAEVNDTLFKSPEILV